MRVDVRMVWSVVGLAAVVHAVGALVATTAGLLLVPSVTVLVGAGGAALLSLIAGLVLHAGISAVFVVAMRRIRASAATCVLNLFLARIPVAVVGVGLAAAGGAFVEAGSTAGFTGLIAHAVYQLGWALLSVVIGTAAGHVWIRWVAPGKPRGRARLGTSRRGGHA